MRHLILLLAMAAAQPNYELWEPLSPRFESTGGTGVMIDGYDPIIALFRAVPVQGGIPCTETRWAAMDRSGDGTSPFQVFIRDGISRRSP